MNKKLLLGTMCLSLSAFAIELPGGELIPGGEIMSISGEGYPGEMAGYREEQIDGPPLTLNELLASRDLERYFVELLSRPDLTPDRIFGALAKSIRQEELIKNQVEALEAQLGVAMNNEDMQLVQQLIQQLESLDELKRDVIDGVPLPGERVQDLRNSSAPSIETLRAYLKTRFPGIFFAIRSIQRQVAAKQIQKVATRNAVKSVKSFTKMIRINRTKQAGDFFKDPVVHGNFSYASVDDKVLEGKGKNSSSSISLTGGLGDDFFAGITLSHDRYRIGGNSMFIQETHSGNFFLGANPSERFSFGIFANYTESDIELGHILGVSFRDNSETFGAGIMASYNYELNDQVNLSVTTSLASVNKKGLDAIFDDEDTQWSTLFDAHVKMTDELALNPFINFAYLIDREAGEPDGSYAAPGVDLVWYANDEWSLRAGYETVLADSSRKENRFNFGASYAF